MKIIVAGSRDVVNRNQVYSVIFQGLSKIILSEQINILQDLEIVSGGARGVDSIAEEFAKQFRIKFHKISALWDIHGKCAGYRRNCEMANYVGKKGALIAIWDGKSKGTKMMIDIAKKKGLTVFIHENH